MGESTVDKITIGQCPKFHPIFIHSLSTAIEQLKAVLNIMIYNRKLT